MQIGLCLRRHIEEKKKNFLHYLVQCSNLLCIQPHKKFLLPCGMQKFAFLYQVGRDLYIRTQHSTLTQFAAILLCHKVHASVYSECKNQLNVNSIRELKDEEKSVTVCLNLCISEQFWGRMDCQSNQATICLSFYYYSQRQIVFELVILVLHDIKYQSQNTLCPKMHKFNFVSIQVDFEKVFFWFSTHTVQQKFFGACYYVSN